MITKICGSGLARESVMAFQADVAHEIAFASKPAPTGVEQDPDHSQGGKESQQPPLLNLCKKTTPNKQNTPSDQPLAANVADVAPITLGHELADKIRERAAIFNTGKFLGNICPSSRSATKSDIRDARQKCAKTRHF